MKSFTLTDIGIIKMMTRPHQEIVNSGHRIINTFDNYIYEFQDTEWIKGQKAKI
jgi:hypothetical protein